MARRVGTPVFDSKVRPKSRCRVWNAFTCASLRDRREFKTESPAAIFEFFLHVLPISAAKIDDTVPEAATVLQLMRECSSLRRENLHSDARIANGQVIQHAPGR